MFELTPRAGGGWTEKVLHNFTGINDGLFPSAGNLYGTTGNGGAYAEGTVFELSPAGGSWTEKVLHNFGNGNDGRSPQSSLILDVAGNLYGPTFRGGTANKGTVFEIKP